MLDAEVAAAQRNVENKRADVDQANANVANAQAAMNSPMVFTDAAA